MNCLILKQNIKLNFKGNIFFQMNPAGIDLSTFHRDHKESSIWDVWNITADRVLMPASPTTSFAVLTFEINMRRRLVFSSYMLTMPPVFLACITLVVFWLPPERPDRTSLGEFLSNKSINCERWPSILFGTQMISIPVFSLIVQPN